MRRRFPSLKVVFDALLKDEGDAEALNRVLNSTDIPQLQFLQVIQRFPLPSFTSQYLTTLECGQPQELIPAWMTRSGSQAQLPALKHLRLLAPTSFRHYPIDELLAMFEVFGPQLLSLRVGGFACDASAQVLPAEIWRYCPQLERIDTGFSFDTPPPPDHPIHTISVFSPALYVHGAYKNYLEPFPIRILEQFSEHSRLQRIILQTSWNETSRSIIDTRTRFNERTRTWLRDCARICMGKGVRLEDIHGVEFGSSELPSLFSQV
jgi:hypothetical protein